jgi:hypothetical protein
MSVLSYLPSPVKRLGRKIIGDGFRNHGEISDRDGPHPAVDFH